MSKIQDVDLSKESIQVQELLDNLKVVLNNGNYEIEVTAASQPPYSAPNVTKFVLSVYGNQFRLYVSFLSNWYYATLTKV
jgi:hypothetical protein